MIIIPIRTETAIRRTPHVNYALIGANVLVYLVFNQLLQGRAFAEFRASYLIFDSTEPTIYQFFTYQFSHADGWHLLGNMIFLWVFGNSVNAKMGDWPYLLFYLAGGVFAAWGYAAVSPTPFRLLGASGAIAAVTTAYLVLFPRSRVTVLFWFFFIHFFELPAMLIIGLKVILWDNVISPSIGGAGNVAYQAHLAGYLFGFVAAIFMLLVRALPRDQFDMLALWKRWNQRRAFAAAMADPASRARAQYGATARLPAANAKAQEAQDRVWNQIAECRRKISELLEQRDLKGAAEEYEHLLLLDPKQCLSEMQQLDVAREFYRSGRFPQAAASFERFLECYPQSREYQNVRLLLGIIYARDLKQFETADEHLTRSMEKLHEPQRRAQCLEWLREVRAALGRPAPEG